MTIFVKVKNSNYCNNTNITSTPNGLSQYTLVILRAIFLICIFNVALKLCCIVVFCRMFFGQPSIRRTNSRQHGYQQKPSPPPQQQCRIHTNKEEKTQTECLPCKTLKPAFAVRTPRSSSNASAYDRSSQKDRSTMPTTPRHKKQPYTIIHIYFFILALLEVGHQYTSAYEKFIKQAQFSQGIYFTFSSLFQAKVFVELYYFHVFASYVFFGTRNWWIAMVASVRCYILASLLRFDSDPRPSPVQQIVLALSFLIFFCLFSFSYTVVPEALWCQKGINDMAAEHPDIQELAGKPVQLVFYSNVSNSNTKDIFTIICVTLQFLIPFCLILFASIISWHSVVANTRNSCRRFRKAILIISLLSSTYFLFEAPLFITNIAASISSQLDSGVNTNTTVTTATPNQSYDKDYDYKPLFVALAELLSHVDCTINAFIYMFADSGFMDIVKGMLCNGTSEGLQHRRHCCSATSFLCHKSSSPVLIHANKRNDEVDQAETAMGQQKDTLLSHPTKNDTSSIICHPTSPCRNSKAIIHAYDPICPPFSPTSPSIVQADLVSLVPNGASNELLGPMCNHGTTNTRPSHRRWSSPWYSTTGGSCSTTKQPPEQQLQSNNNVHQC